MTAVDFDVKQQPYSFPLPASSPIHPSHLPPQPHHSLQHPHPPPPPPHPQPQYHPPPPHPPPPTYHHPGPAATLPSPQQPGRPPTSAYAPQPYPPPPTSSQPPPPQQQQQQHSQPRPLPPRLDQPPSAYPAHPVDARPPLPSPGAYTNHSPVQPLPPHGRSDVSSASVTSDARQPLAEQSLANGHHHPPPPPSIDTQLKLSKPSPSTPTNSKSAGLMSAPGNHSAPPPHTDSWPAETPMDVQAYPAYSDPYGGPDRRYSMPHHDNHAQMPPPQTYVPHSGPADHAYHASYSAEQQDAHQRRKAVRAAQACENCRQKKSKCDESHPCANCVSSNISCIYRPAPVPKQEKSMLQVTDLIQNVQKQLTEAFTDALGSHGSSIELLLKEMISVKKSIEEIRSNQGALTRSPSSSSAYKAPQYHARSSQPAQSPGGRLTGEDMKRTSSLGQHFAAPTRAQMNQHAPQQQHQSSGAVASAEEYPTGKELAIPREHNSGAHHLERDWLCIKRIVSNPLPRPFNEHYIFTAEENRGILRLYSTGMGSQRVDPSTGASPPAPSNYSDSPNGLDNAYWGVGIPRRCCFDPPENPSTVFPGGLNDKGILQLDENTVRQLYRSYLKNVHALQPFLDEKRMEATLNRMFSRHPTAAQSNDGFVAPPNHLHRQDSAGMKRKRSDQDSGINDRTQPYRSQNAQASTSQLERSIDTVLLLLVCALGRICNETDDLPVVHEYPGPLDPIMSPGVGMSPSNSQTSRSSNAHLDVDNLRHQHLGRKSPSYQSQQEKHSQGHRNVETIPGLAYYAYASSVLGEVLGGDSLQHVSAFLMCGLYQAQLIRVMESYRWIHLAATSCQILIKRLGYPKNSDELPNSVRIAFWACLQLESDILAELSMPPSGITMFEEDFPWPTIEATGDIEKEKIMIAFQSQINLRKILNQAHTNLYNTRDGKLKNPDFAITQASALVRRLDDWRQIVESMAARRSELKDVFSWQEDDPPANDINVARVRGKYYGARYLCLRMFLRDLLDREVREGAEDSGQSYTSNSPYASTARSQSPQTRGHHEIIANAQQETNQESMWAFSQQCVSAAINSTLAFDGVRRYGRLRVTNIFGTAHAQFGNMLVLSAACSSTRYPQLLDYQKYKHLMERTQKFLEPLGRLSPTMQADLVQLRKYSQAMAERFESQPASAATSFSNNSYNPYLLQQQ